MYLRELSIQRITVKRLTHCTKGKFARSSIFSLCEQYSVIQILPSLALLKPGYHPTETDGRKKFESLKSYFSVTRHCWNNFFKHHQTHTLSIFLTKNPNSKKKSPSSERKSDPTQIFEKDNFHN